MRTYDVWFPRYALRNRLMFSCQEFLPAMGPGSTALLRFLACGTEMVNYQKLSFKIYVITNEIHLKLQSADNGFQSLSRKYNPLVHPGLQPMPHYNHKALNVMCLKPLDHLDTILSADDNLW